MKLYRSIPTLLVTLVFSAIFIDASKIVTLKLTKYKEVSSPSTLSYRKREVTEPPTETTATKGNSPVRAGTPTCELIYVPVTESYLVGEEIVTVVYEIQQMLCYYV